MNWAKTKRMVSKPVFTVLCGMLPALAVADDTEIYFTDLPEGQGVANVLFILDHSGSMAKNPSGGTLEDGAENGDSRYQIMRRVFGNVLNDLPKSLSAGLMTYGGHNLPSEANGVKYPVSLLTDAQRTGLKDTLDGFEVGGYTPIVQSIYEASLYFRGDNADYGSSANPVQEAHPGSLDSGASSADEIVTVKEAECFTGSHCDTITAQGGVVLETPETCRLLAATAEYTNETDGDICIGGTDEAGRCSEWNQITETVPANPERTLCEYSLETKELVPNYTYQSPIGSECQPSYIILLSDGEPDDGEVGSDSSIQQKVAALTGRACSGVQNDGFCGAEITNHLATEDIRTDLEEIQTVKTYTVGFANSEFGNNYLSSLSNLGEGSVAGEGSFSANDESELQQVFTEIIDEIAGQTSSLLPLTLSVDDANRFETGDKVYLPLFRPGFLPRWSGNLKKYQLDGTVLKDKKNVEILDNGEIKKETQDFWSDDADTGTVRKGGAASKLTKERNLLTDDAPNSLEVFSMDSATANSMGLKGDDLGLHEKIVLFAKGIEPDGELLRNAMGDILHSRPVLVDYGRGIDEAGKVIFASTNEGYLHAFNIEGGTELFAFMPQSVLPILPTLYKNDPDDLHPYGMDGPITVWKYDANEDGVIDPNSDHVYLYAGMRRGGDNYYALDVTNPVSPKLLWTIKGGKDGSSGFGQLGQTWSKPIVAKVELNKGEEPQYVLLFGGGYDEQHDEVICEDDVETLADCAKESRTRAATKGRTADLVGNKIFMVGAKSGELLWSAGYGNIDSMRNAIAADLSVVDMDGNGIADRVYAADLGGRVFRLDFPDSEHKQFDDIEDLDEPQVRLFADLGGDNAESNRRFYYAPDVSVVKDGIKRYVALSIGSGYRAHPLDKGDGATQNSIFMLKDTAVTSLLADNYVSLERGGLLNATGSPIANDSNGWYIDLKKESGEKVLAKAVTVNNTAYLTSFTPSDPPENVQCSPATHQASIYSLDIRDGGGVRKKFTDGEEEEVRVSRVTTVATTGILSEVSLVFSQGEGGSVKVDVLAGSGLTTAKLEGSELPALLKVYWEEER